MTGSRTRRLLGITLAALALFVLIAAAGVRPATADDLQRAQQLVERGRFTLQNFTADPALADELRALLRKAKGVLIYPQVFRAAFLFGGAGGSGVLLTRDEKSGEWAGPAFYSMGQASFGPQAGAAASEVVLVALTERGVTALLSPSAKLGVDVGIAVGPVGIGAAAATANLSADIVSYSRFTGLYAGLSLEGAYVTPRDDLNRAFYELAASPRDILISRTTHNPQAAPLVEALTKAAASEPRVAAGY